jgi:cystathionine beta-synthase
MRRNFDENEIYSYITEGIGEDITIECRFSLIDGFTKVTDKDAVYTRRIALEEGIFVGNSAGAAIKGCAIKGSFQARRCSCSLFHDSGSRYGKMFNDDWMRERGFLEEEVKKAEDVIKIILIKPLIFGSYRRIGVPCHRMRKYKISQIR